MKGAVIARGFFNMFFIRFGIFGKCDDSHFVCLAIFHDFPADLVGVVLGQVL